MMARNLFNFLAFQAGWFSCVLGSANGIPWLGPVVVAVVIAVHLVLAITPAREFKLIILALCMGLVFDSILVSSGWLRYPNGMVLPGIAPYWILAMWALFATTLNVSMSWMKSSPWLALVMGAVFGPLSYLAGQRLGALEFVNFRASMIALGLIWALALPLLVLAANRLNGMVPFAEQPAESVS